MKKIVKLTTILAACALLTAVAGCSREELDTNQFTQTGVSLQAYGPQPVVRGGVLRFIGSNLQDVSSVTIPGISPITSIEVVKSGVPSEIRVTVPKDGPEPGFVTLTTKDGKTITAKTQISYSEPIEITAISPAAVYPGEQVTITGDYLNLIHEVIFTDEVKVPETAFSKHDRYSITVTVPADAKTGVVGLGTIDESTVTDETLLANLNIVESENELTVKTAEGKLASSSLKAGDEVVINGTRLDLVTAVKVEGATVTEFTGTASKITFPLPESATDGEVLLVHASGVEVSAGTIGTAIPTGLSASPAPVKSGAELTISGKNLDLVNGINVPNAGDVEFSYDGKIVFTVPEAAQEGDLTLSLANGKTVTVAYTLVKPVLTEVNPNPASAGSDVVLTGTDLDLVKSVTFGGGIEVEAAPSETEIVLAVPTAAESGALTLNLLNGTSLESLELAIDKPAGAYIPVFPEDLYTPGSVFIVDIVNSEHLTGVRIDGNEVKYILSGDQLFVHIPAEAKRNSQLTLESDNGAVTYTMNIDPGDIIETTLWTGSLPIANWANNEMKPNDMFLGAEMKPGQTIRIYVSNVADWWNIQLYDGHWGQLNVGYGVDGNPHQINASVCPTAASEGYIPITLTEEMIKLLTTSIDWGYAFIVQGEGLTFDKITYYEDNTYGETIWTGLFICNQWNGDQSLAWDGYDWSTVPEGSTLFFHMTPMASPGEWWCISLRHGTNWGALAGVPGQYDSPETPLGVKLTREILNDLIANGGLVVTGTGYMLEKVSLK